MGRGPTGFRPCLHTSLSNPTHASGIDTQGSCLESNHEPSVWIPDAWVGLLNLFPGQNKLSEHVIREAQQDYYGVDLA